jgi:hypothetical protein
LRLDVFLEVDFRVVPRLAGLLLRLEDFRPDEAPPRVPVLFEVVRFRPLVLELFPPDRLVLESDRAADFRRRFSAPTPTVPAAPTAAPRSGPAAPLAIRVAPLMTFCALLCFFFPNISSSSAEYAPIYARGWLV